MKKIKCNAMIWTHEYSNLNCILVNGPLVVMF